MGYPNAYDRSFGRTGAHLMVHGACSSAGCYSMTDEDAGELFALARDSFRGGQRAFQIQAFPFRMTPENMAKHRDSQHLAFWRNLKEGSDHFELTRIPPKIDVCGKRMFNAGAGEPRTRRRPPSPRLRVDRRSRPRVDISRSRRGEVRRRRHAAGSGGGKAAEEKRLAEERRASPRKPRRRRSEARGTDRAITKKLGVGA
jgi:hypothetical protein